MFSGLVTAIGTVITATDRDGGRVLVIAHPYGALDAGESVAVNGACLTVEQVSEDAFQAHAVPATLARTRIGSYQAGTRVNLERALRIGDRIGGHLVQGHVDGVGRVDSVETQGDERILQLVLPDDVAAISVVRGSLTVDGVSLTVNAMPGHNRARLVCVPFTLQHTTLAGLRAGDAVHLEADLIGRYVHALLTARGGPT